MNKKPFQWAVIGGGPAGIAAVGKLLDSGVHPSLILWIDPCFKVGDLGQLWSNVSSNTTVKRFTDFLSAVDAFAYYQSPVDFQLNHLPPNNTCVLKHVVEPLQWISDKLSQTVAIEQTTIQSIALSNRLWSLRTSEQEFHAQQVILATGALPTEMNHSSVPTLSLRVAMDKERLAQAITPSGSYAVFGSSHSAIIIIRYLVELGVKKIINFYRSPCRYALEMGEWILFDNTGLKGETALWAKENIDGALPPNLVRYPASESNLACFLPECDNAIYAIGFEKRSALIIEDYEKAPHNPYVGIIAPGLFGLGIAYPEIKTDPYGNIESQVGLWKFMVYLNKVMPIWLKYSA